MSARFFRESGWYHGSFTPFVPILRGRKAFFITTVMDDTRRARRLGAPHRTAADDFVGRAEVVTPYELSALTLSQNHSPKENWSERKAARHFADREGAARCREGFARAGRGPR